jgi:hypothetical protein
MGEVKILARGNLPLPPVGSAVLLSRLFVSLLAAFGEGSRQLRRGQFVRLSWDLSSAKPSHGQRPLSGIDIGQDLHLRLPHRVTSLRTRLACENAS